MKNKQKEFCKLNNLTQKQFFGEELVGGSLHLVNLTSIPDGFNPTVGGSLDLENLTSIPDGFNPTVGGSLYLRNKLYTETKKPKSPIKTPKNKLLFWQKGKYVYADEIFTEVVHNKGNIYKVKKIHSNKEFYLVSDGYIHAHGETLKKAKEDFRFKIISEKIKKEPILPNTKITIQYYRIITGACEYGVKSFKEQHNLKDEYLAKDLLPILEKNNAYGVENFKKLINW